MTSPSNTGRKVSCGPLIGREAGPPATASNPGSADRRCERSIRQHLQEPLRLPGGHAELGAQPCAALGGRAMEQPLGRGHHHHQAGLQAAARLAEDHHPLGIAAKALDVVADPFQRSDQVGHAVGSAVGELGRRAQIRQMQEPERRQPVVQRHRHHVAKSSQVFRAVVAARAGAVDEAAAVKRDHHRPLGPVGGRGPDVEHQAVFAHAALEAVVLDQLPVLAPGIHRLRGLGPIVEGLAHAGPGLGREGGHVAVLAAGRRAIGDALEGDDAADVHALELAIGRVDRDEHRPVGGVGAGDEGRGGGEPKEGPATNACDGA